MKGVCMKKVLIIDDTKNIRSMLTTCLEIRDYEVLASENGIVALEILEKIGKEIDLIFLDIRMPGLSGTEVLKVLREKNINSAVIIMTAFATVKNAIDCTKLGAFAYLQKPFSPDRVNAIIDEVENTYILSEEKEENYKEKACNDEVYIIEAKESIELNKYKEAFEVLKKALASNPYNKEVYKLIGKINELEGNEDEANRFYAISELFS
jgi:DNA-binding NtrC family response regulator